MITRIPPVWILAAIALSQAIVGQFVMFGLPLFLREAGVGSEITAMIFLAAIPYVARFVWAPLVDHFGLKNLGHYRSWLIGSQAIVVAAVAALWMWGDPANDGMRTILMLPPLTIALGTQLVALAGMTTTLLHSEDYGRAASLQSAAAGLAGFLLGAVGLYLLGSLGWRAVVGAVFLQSALSLLLILLHELDQKTIKSTTTSVAHTFAAIFSLFRRKNLAALFIVLTVTTVGIDIGYGMKSLILSDAGLGVQQAGLWGIVVANLAGMLAALAARSLIARVDELKVLLVLGALSGVWTLGFATVLTVDTDARLAIAFIVGAVALVFAGAVVSQSLLMRLVDHRTASTEIAVFGALGGVAALLINAVASAALDRIGLPSVLLVGGTVSLAGAAVGAWIARHQRLLKVAA